jgi:restriction system protein
LKDYDQAQKEYEIQLKARELAQKEYEAQQVRVKRQFWQSLTGPQFEHELAQLFSRTGYQVYVTPISGDEGIDIVMRKDDKKIVVQCKAHQNPVGPGVVRELYGAMMHANANEAILASLGGFTQGVLAFVKGNRSV